MQRPTDLTVSLFDFLWRSERDNTNGKAASNAARLGLVSKSGFNMVRKPCDANGCAFVCPKRRLLVSRLGWLRTVHLTSGHWLRLGKLPNVLPCLVRNEQQT